MGPVQAPSMLLPRFPCVAGRAHPGCAEAGSPLPCAAHSTPAPPPSRTPLPIDPPHHSSTPRPAHNGGGRPTRSCGARAGPPQAHPDARGRHQRPPGRADGRGIGWRGTAGAGDTSRAPWGQDGIPPGRAAAAAAPAACMHPAAARLPGMPCRPLTFYRAPSCCSRPGRRSLSLASAAAATGSRPCLPSAGGPSHGPSWVSTWRMLQVRHHCNKAAAVRMVGRAATCAKRRQAGWGACKPGQWARKQRSGGSCM